MMKRTLWYVCLGLLCCGALAMVVSAATNNPASTVTTKSANGSGPSNVNPKAVTPSTSIATRQIHAQTNVPPVAKAPAFESAKGEDVDRAFERALNGHSRPGDKEILAGYIPVQNHADPNPLDQGADNCPATAFSALPYSDGGTTVGYVNNFAESCVFDGGAPDVIYAYTAGVNSTVRVSLVGSGYDTGLSVRTGGACPGTTEVACNDDFTGLQSQVDVVVTSGTVYFIVVDGYSSSSGTYTLNVTDIGGVRPCPVMEPDDANLDPMPTSPWAGSIAGNCGNGGKWVGEFTGVAGHEYHFDLCPDAPGAGTCWGDADIKICDAAGTILAGIDGSCTAITWAPNNFQWSAPAAGSYYVVIAPYYSYGVHSCTGTASETFTMQYYDAGACTPPTPNDNCANAGGPWTPPATITGNNGCSTHDC